MGQTPSVQGKCLESIIKVMKSQGLIIILEEITELLRTVKVICPSFSLEEELDPDEWKLVGEQLGEQYNYLCDILPFGSRPNSVSKDTIHTYNLIQMALKNVILKEEMKEQNGEVSTKLGEKDESDNNEVKYNSEQQQQEHLPSPPSINPSWVEQEGGEEEAETQTELPVKKPKPMTRLEKALVKAKREGQDISDFIHAYPVIENTDSVGKKRRRYAPLDLNTIKDLKKGCTLYGATSAYVKMLLDGLSYEVLTPNDWKSIARTCLEPGENLLWLAEFHELCKIQVRCNLEIGVNTQFTFEHLAGEGQYGENSEQINYTMTIYEQIAKAAIKAWGVLPGQKDRGEAFTKIQQGPNEPFADFVGRLQTAVKRTIGENSATEIMTRHLAKENANEICKRIIWGLDKDAPLEEIIRRCATVGTNAFYTQTMMNVERQGPSWQGPSRETRRCFQCGKIGHLRAQ
ncbi:endogenous retrovirus group K member 5 Gag polyprotein-like [Sminthopsis crassicaudata]|uniref:endogenous retrovirus group K member 5 Gag polyprotein-like n=1 Tax=Sminthopsis crassicaudata TaxID=9301 RepID=UPI003D690BC6